MSSKSDKTRARILDTTLQLLENGGGNGVRMSDIAKAAGISRQALYLHFPNRAELLVAATRHVDELNDIDGKLAPSRAARSGRDRLRLWVEVWGGYIPTIHGVAKALMAMEDSDADAKAAWEGRMQAVRKGCAAAVAQLSEDGDLAPRFDQTQATDLLWTLLSVRNWEMLTRDCGWSQDAYIAEMARTAELALTA